MDAREDPDVDAAVRAYQVAAYKSKAGPEKPEEMPELTAKVQRKYVAAQVVAVGSQVSARDTLCALVLQKPGS